MKVVVSEKRLEREREEGGVRESGNGRSHIRKYRARTTVMY